jgi:hypothetical protein
MSNPLDDLILAARSASLARAARAKPVDEGDRLQAGTLDPDPSRNCVPTRPLAEQKAMIEARDVPEPPDRVTDDRPALLVTTDHEALVMSAIHVLARRENLYKRGSRLCTVIRPTVTEGDAAPEKLIDEAPQIRDVSASTLHCMLTSLADWVKRVFRKGEFVLVQTTPPSKVVQAILDRGEYPGIPQLVGVSETPTIDRDLEISMVDGYDATTGVFFWPNAEYIDIPRAPTQRDAQEAYARLVEPISQFPFEPLDLGRAVCASAILTVLARHAIAGPTPIFLLTKNVRGAGATLLADVIAIVATGRAAPRMTLSGDEAEQEKVLASFALAGTQLICFDNVTSLGGGPLDKCVTASDTVSLRVLGRSEIATVAWRAIVITTGNNVDIQGDTTRRTLVADLCSLDERPETRTGWSIPDLRVHVAEHRVELVRDAMILIAAYRAAGRPSMGVRPFGSFEAWSAVVANAIRFAGGPDVVGAYAEAQGVVDAKKTAAATLLAHWELLPNAAAGLTVKQVLAALYTYPQTIAFEDLRDAVEALAPTPAGKLPSGRALGKELARLRRRVMGARMLDASTGQGGVLRWHVVTVASSSEGGLGGLGGLNPKPSHAIEKKSINGTVLGTTHPTNPTHPTDLCERVDRWIGGEE